MQKGFRSIWNICTAVLIAVVLALAVALAGVRLIGLQPMSVLSGSMEPEYPVGSIIYVRKVDYRDLKPGDVITFMLNEDTVATHRIVEVIPDEEEPDTLRFRTKGDANDSEDGGLVHYKNVIGTPVCMIPKLGYIAAYIRNPPGKYLAISFGAVLILLVFLPELIDSLREDSEAKKEDEPKREKRGKTAPPKAEKPRRIRPPKAEQPPVADEAAEPAAPEASGTPERHERRPAEKKPVREKKPIRVKKQKYIPKH